VLQNITKLQDAETLELVNFLWRSLITYCTKLEYLLLSFTLTPGPVL